MSGYPTAGAPTSLLWHPPDMQETQLSDLKEQVSRARLRVEELEGEVQGNVALEDDGEGRLLYGRRG